MRDVGSDRLDLLEMGVAVTSAVHPRMECILAGVVGTLRKYLLEQ